ncbi:hypothetical protein LCGC14_0843370 [marine sediment metagenome]|uniref:6-phosphogluconate dehydrogenase C-terminal domain-containing protein n=1 Tax=marine sediment metagenome TaxID=412755 RepID=A0A0F9SJL8_9ZZZZ
MNKQIAIIGLGKMGGNITLHLLEKGWDVTGYNVPHEVTKGYEKQGVNGAYSYKEIADRLEKPRLIWLMLPSAIVDLVLFGKDGSESLLGHLDAGDVIIDGGNSLYKETIRRAKAVQEKGIEFVDVGVSGGPRGAREGSCLMIGGNEEIFKRFEHLYKDLAAKDAYQFFKGSGAGHFVKMVHNGIEYGMMQSIAEGFAVMKESDFNIDLKKAADVYDHSSVIESRLVGWLKDGFETYGIDLEDVSGSVGHTGEAEWTVGAAKELGVRVEIIEESLKFREDSADKPSYTGKILSALRDMFGGHGVKR